MALIRTFRLLIASAAFGLGVASAAHCQPSPTSSAQTSAGQPDGGEAPADEPGYTLIKDRCGACHSADYVLGSRRTASDWRDTILQMINRGADANETEAAQIQAYLEKYRLIAPR